MKVTINSFEQIHPQALVPIAWKSWRDHEGFFSQFLQLLRSLEDSGSATAECLKTLKRIVPGNSDDWYREWKKQADSCKRRGDLAFTQGLVEAAQRNWLHASAFYRSAGSFLAASDQKQLSLNFSIEACSRLYLKCMDPAGEPVCISYGHDNSIQGYFLRAPNSDRPSPAVICFGGAHETKDELLEKMPRFAFDQGLSLLVVDNPKSNHGAGGDFVSNMEVPIGACVDYLLGRGDVDGSRLAIFGDNFGATQASRIASLDHRFSAAVCDGGIWYENKNAQFPYWASMGDGGLVLEETKKLPKYRLARRLQCPFLVTSAEHEFLNMKDVIDLYEHCRKLSYQMEFKFFPAEDVGVARRKFIFNWIASKIVDNGEFIADPERSCVG